MDLYEAIKNIVDKFGKNVITERRFTYMVADYYSFRDNSAEKHVLSAIVNGGHSVKFLNSDIGKTELDKIEDELCRCYGYRKDLVEEVINSLLKGLKIANNEEDVAPLAISIVSEDSIYTNENINNTDILSDDFFVSLYSSIFSRYAHLDAQRIYKALNISVKEVYVLINFLQKIKALHYNQYTQFYDVCVSSPEDLIKLYRDWKNNNGQNTKQYNNEKGSFEMN